MRKWMIRLVLLVTVAIVGICGLLPGVYAKIQDRVMEGNVEYAPVKTVSFQAKSDMMEKLFFLRDGYKVPLSERGSDIDVDKMYQRVPELLNEFFEIAIAEGVTYEFIDPEVINKLGVSAKKVFLTEANDASPIFWLVEIPYSDGNVIFSLWIDDETGNILSMDYQSEYQLFDDHKLDEVLSLIQTAYYAQSGFESILDEKNYSVTDTPINEEVIEDKKGSVEVWDRYTDPLYGDLSIYFNVNNNGFFIQMV